MKTKIGAYGDKVHTNSCDLNVPEDDIESKSFTLISIDSLLAYEKKYYSFIPNCRRGGKVGELGQITNLRKRNLNFI